MKKLVLTVGLIFGISAHAVPTTYHYVCGCIDTGLECDGMEEMELFVTGELAKLELGATADLFQTRLDRDYEPRSLEHRGYSKFKIMSHQGILETDALKSSFLLQNTILQGAKYGDVKFQEVSSESVGGGFHAWLFRCTRK